MDAIKGPHLAHLSTRASALLTAAVAAAGFSASFASAQGHAVATVPPLNYKSVLSQYQGYNDQALMPWQETNETVGKIGGWRVYAKEARQSDSPAGMASNPSGKPTEPASEKASPQSHHGSKP